MEFEHILKTLNEALSVKEWQLEGLRKENRELSEKVKALEAQIKELEAAKEPAEVNNDE